MNKSALVIDDSVTVRKLVGRTLQQAGIEVAEAGNGREALAALKGKAFQLIVVDLNMPVMDGLEFIRALREDPEHKFTPVVFLTTETESRKIEAARAAGATGWIVKPFHPNKLKTVINRVFS